MNEKAKEVLKNVLGKYGKVEDKGDSIEVTNTINPSFRVEIDGEDKVEVSPILGSDVPPGNWAEIADKQAVVIKNTIRVVIKNTSRKVL